MARPRTTLAQKPTEALEEVEPEVTEPEITCQDECSSAGLKRCSNNSYQTCGNYDADACSEWSPITNCPSNTVCQNGICIQQKCTDGTLYGQCSTNKPIYCDNGNLIDKCSICGCPSGQECHTDESCIAPSAEIEYWAVLADSSADRPIGITNASILLKDMLRHKGWQENHIKCLAGENATYANLMAALDWLAVNSDSNDIVLVSISAHGSPSVLSLVDTYLKYSELAKKFDNISYGGFVIIIHACESHHSISYLQKGNRVILLPNTFPECLLRALLGFGDIEGNNDNWVSVGEIFNFLEPEPNTLIQDDYSGELNIVFLNRYLRHLDQYNVQKSPIAGLVVGARMENEISWLAQSFKPNYPILTKVMLDLYRQGNPGPLTVSVGKNLSGPNLTSVTLAQDKFYYKDNFVFSKLYEFDFPDVQVIPGETYYVIIGAPHAVWEEDYNNIYGLTYNKDYYPKGKLFTFYEPRVRGPAGVWSPAENDLYFVDATELDLFFATFGKPK